MKRPDKIKLDVIKDIPAGLKFFDTLGKRGVSVYVQKLAEALASGGAVRVSSKDGHMRHQLRKASSKLKLKLVYALDGEFLYVKPIQSSVPFDDRPDLLLTFERIEGEMKRLTLLLREPRTLAELQSKKLELHLENSLGSMLKDGTAHEVKGKWVLTERGMDLL